MIITQKYHSAFDIDLEFIPSLEQLLADTIPSFEWIKDFEQNASENIYFNYYLFFGQHHNAPIGFAQIMIHANTKPNEKLSFFGKIFGSKNGKNKQAQWIIPGVFNEGILFEPRYRINAIDKTISLFEEYNDREDIDSQSIKFGQAYDHLCDKYKDKMIHLEQANIVEGLVINQSNYEEYLASLQGSIKDKIMQDWKELHHQDLSIEDYQSFKELFAYKQDGAKLYKELKNKKNIKRYLKLETLYLSLFKDRKIYAIIFLIKGQHGHYFYDYIVLEESFEQRIVDQMPIMHCYDDSQCQRLHPLFNLIDEQYYKKLGFITKKQFSAQIKS